MALTNETARQLETLFRNACNRLRYRGLDREEIIQEALLRAHKYFLRYCVSLDHITNLDSWALRVVRNAAVDMARKLQDIRRPPSSPRMVFDSRLIISCECKGNGHAAQRDLKYYRDLLRHRMDEAGFEAVEMLLNGRSRKEIAILLHVPQKQVVDWLMRATEIVLSDE